MGIGTQMETKIQIETRTQILCMPGENEVKLFRV